jgi:hypothetical protein
LDIITQDLPSVSKKEREKKTSDKDHPLKITTGRGRMPRLIKIQPSKKDSF